MQLEMYQHLPEHINPIIFQIGFFSIKWYSFMYLIGFAVVYVLMKYRKKEILLIENQKSKISAKGGSASGGKNQNDNLKIKNVFGQINVADLTMYLIVGLLIGARLGYVIFYNLPYYLAHPLEIIFPVQITNYRLQVMGFYGMSYFGGLIGSIFSSLVFCKKYKINFWQLADFVIPAVPAGYFFGRIGNFLNGELYGRVTDMPWGMYFPADPYGLLRHPSQLYEAFLEGIILFVILWILRNKKQKHCHPELVSGSKKLSIRFRIMSGMTSDGSFITLYIFFYGLFRFFIEFFREPDPQIGLFFSWLTLGQIFSAAVMVIAMLIFVNKKSSEKTEGFSVRP